MARRKKPTTIPTPPPRRKRKASIVRPGDDHQDTTPEVEVEGGDGEFIPLSWMMRYDQFIQQYLETGDSLGSAKAAGFVSTKGEQGQRGVTARLLEVPYVRDQLRAQYQSIKAKARATQERVWEEVARTAFCDIGKAYGENGEPLPMHLIPEETRRAITGYKVVTKTFGEDGESVEKELKFGGKSEALSQLIRLHGMGAADKLVVVDGESFQRAMAEGRERARNRTQR